MSADTNLWAEDGLGDSGWHENCTPALAAWGIGDKARVTLLSLSENATWRIDLPDGDAAVLRLHRPGYRRPEEIRSEILWLEELAGGHDIPVAAPRRTLTGELVAEIALPKSPDGSARQIAVLFDLVPGQVLDSPDMLRLSRDCGRMAGLLQRQIAGWAQPAGFTRPVLDIETAIGVKGHWGYWGDHPYLTPATRDILTQVDAKLRAEIAAYGTPPTRYGLIHGDMRAANMIMGPRGLTLIDFDDCAMTWHLYELACAMTFVETDPALPRMIADWVEGYGRSVTLDAADLAAIPAFLMLRRLLITGWFATHHHTVEAPTLAADYAAETEAIGRAYLANRFARL